MYTEQLSSSKPGLVIILIDQSGSMQDVFGSQKKSEFAALAVNRVIAEIITACTAGDNIKDRCYVAVIGYGSTVDIQFLEKVSDLAKNTNTTTLKKNVSDGAGGLVEVDEIMRIFVNPVANGGTPMADAFKQAYTGAEKFVANNPNSFPPIVINITDGEPDSIPTANAEGKRLMEIKTTDGNLILMNAHISDAKAGKIELPNSDSGFAANSYAKFLFDISSILPDALADKAKAVGFNAQTNARGFVFNADAETLVRLLNFGSLGALR